ncbi:3-hydroxyacyl-CoA dehydrogenase family protein [Nonomuraea sp. NPDC046802]|uniref:3-hydroxyacyl-CoA dehydrogenase family protein n=1 Tax=Nonomuraea sp. NPDC046802 TaxID=3154919 RepID=UPI0033E4DD91
MIEQGPTAVLGAGVMGTGIATLLTGHGLSVLLIDSDPRALREAVPHVRNQLRLARMMKALPPGRPTGHLTTRASLEYADGVSAVVESVTEHPQLKLEVLGEVSAIVEPGTLLASNTSAIPIDELAEATSRPQDLVGLHFMNPPFLIDVVEVIRGPRSGEAAMAAVNALLAATGRRGVIVGDGPGFVINRILQRMINEAVRIVEEDIATPEDVDALFTGCLGHAIGPLATADLIGLDNVADSLAVLHARTGEAGYRPAPLLLAKVRAGELGRKSGRGFFEHTGTS